MDHFENAVSAVTPQRSILTQDWSTETSVEHSYTQWGTVTLQCSTVIPK